MATIITRPLSIALAGEPKSGKSTVAAKIVKKYGGIICDFSRVNQSGGMDKTPVKYNVSNEIKQIGEDTIIEVGEAYTAMHKVGVGLENYKLILNWQDFENAVAYARVLSEDILKKKIWIVIDDTTAMRWHKAIEIKDRLGHKSIAQKDWGIAASELKLMVSSLSKEFNLFMINQMMDEYHEFDIIDENGKTTKEKQKNQVRRLQSIPAATPHTTTKASAGIATYTCWTHTGACAGGVARRLIPMSAPAAIQNNRRLCRTSANRKGSTGSARSKKTK
jgi:hypothetical protein